MSEKKESPEEPASRFRGLNKNKKRDKIERLSLLKKDSKNFAKRILKDDSVTLLAGREKTNALYKIKSCADYLTVRHMLVTGKTKVIQARLCKNHLLCSFCAHLRASKLIQKYIKVYKNVVGNQKSYHIVFTIKDGSDFKERFNHLNSSIRSILADRRRHTGELSKVTSGIYAYESKKGKNSGTWHPHIHAIMLTSEYIDYSKLRAEWKKITGDSFNVNVTEFYGNGDEKNLIKPFLEVFKYSLKHNELTDSERLQCYKILYGRKLVNSFGQFRGFSEPESLLDEVSLDDVFYMDLILQYNDDKGYLPMEKIEFSKEFKAVFKLQEAYKKHGPRVIDRFFNQFSFDLLMERTGIDFKNAMIEMIKSNILGEEEIRKIFIEMRGGDKEAVELEGSPEPIGSAPETETDIQEWISEAIYNETDKKKG